MNANGHAPAGMLVAIGGAEDKSANSQILRRVVDLAPEGNRDLGVITTASSIPEEIFPAYRKVFEELGASHVHHLVVRNREDARDRDNVEIARQCGIIFVTGGDQLRLTNILGGSPLLEVIRRRLAEGAVVAGTSAGAAAMSATMIYNGAAADALRKGAVRMSAGLGFVHGVVIDSHFLERGRFTRLMEVGATNPEYVGIGLGEDAGVIIHDGPVLEAIGRGHVIVVDSSEIESSNVAELNDGEPVAVENTKMHALISGYGYDVAHRRYVEPHELQSVLAGNRLADTRAKSATRA